MGHRVLITEKPSVAREYVKALGIQPKEKTEGYTEGVSSVDGKKYRITWAVGHLVTLSYPEVYDPKYKSWRMEDLPFLPSTYLYEVIKDVKKQFNVVKKLYHDPDAESIYYAGDSGQEGIYIQYLIRKEAGVKKGIDEKVVWINSQTEEEILKGIREAKPLKEYQYLIHAGCMRAIEDYSVGINFSRVLTLLYGQEFKQKTGIDKHIAIAVGRVMTCVLGMIVNRENEIKNFKETVFYRPGALCGDFTAKWKAVEGTTWFNSPDIYNNEGFLEFRKATDFVNGLKQAPELRVIKAEKKKELKYAPLLFNLAEIQNECSKLFKISPDKTLEVIQKLYEGKMVTYPRTDARVLSSAVAKEIDINLKGLQKAGVYANEIGTLFAEGRYKNLEKTKYVDDSKITDHYAIIPTGQGSMGTLDGLEKDVYDVIVRRFISIFYEPAEYIKYDVELLHGNNEHFFANEKILVKKGYLEFMGTNDKDKSLLSEIKEGQVINADYNVTEGRTTPPKRYTSGSIILAMENAGNLIEDEELRAQIKGSGIGTSATRAEIIKKLIKNEHIGLEKKTQALYPLPVGYAIYDIVNASVPAMLSPKMTASWEKGLDGIREGRISGQEYMSKLYSYIKSQIEKMKELAPETDPVTPFEPEIVAKCPWCGKNVITTRNGGYKCEDNHKDEGCSFYLGAISGREISVSELQELITNGVTQPMVFTSKAGKAFTVPLRLNRELKKVEFAFEEDGSEEKALQITCPKCKKSMLVQKGVRVKCPKCDFSAYSAIAGRELTELELSELFTNKKIGPLSGFISKGGRPFDATLVYKAGKIKFDF